MSKKNVLLITVRADQGGGPKQVLQIMKYLKNDFNFYVAAPSKEHYSDQFERNAVRYFKIPHRKFKTVTFIKLLFFVRNNQIDIIHSHGFGAGIYSRILGFFNSNIIHTFHGLQLNDSLYSKLKVLIEKILSFSTKRSIAVCASEKEKLLNISLNPIICENGLEASEIEKLRKNKINIPFETVGIIQRLDPNKNLTWIVHNFELLCNTFNKKLNIIIAGEGEEKEKLLSLIEENHLHDRIQLIGFQEKYSFFEKIDLLFSASLGEGLPYTVLEAMSFKVPILATNIPGHYDILEESSMFNLDGEFSPKTEEIIKNLDIHRDRVLSDFTIKSMMEKIKLIYES